MPRGPEVVELAEVQAGVLVLLQRSPQFLVLVLELADVAVLLLYA